MSVIGDMQSSIMTAIDTATSLTSVPWDGDPLAFAPTKPGIGVQWMSGIDSSTEERSKNGAFFQEEHFLILIATEDANEYASSQAFDYMEDISAALNETPITIGGVTNAAVCQPYRDPGLSGNTKQFMAGHGGNSLYVMAFQVGKLTE